MTLFADTLSLELKYSMEVIDKAFEKEKLTIEEKTKLYQYQDYLNRNFKKNTPEDYFYNSNPLHASLLMSNLFSITEYHINMVVGKFAGSVSEKGSYCDELIKCLERGVSINVILLEKDINLNSKALKVLLSSSRNVLLYTATHDTKETLAKQFPKIPDPVHFSTFDNNKYRLEIIPETFAALASFNAPATVKKYNNFFEELILSCNRFR